MIALAVWQIGKGHGGVDDVSLYAPEATPSEEAVLVPVEAGESPQDVGEALERAGVIESATQFEVLVSFLGYDRILQAGEYEFQKGIPALDAVYRIRRGEVSTRTVTVIEGWRLEEIADAVAEEGIDRAGFLAAARAEEFEFSFLADLDESDNLEGYLFPATYSIRQSDEPADVVAGMLQAFADNVPADLAARADEAGLTLHQVVTLASIIEREAVVPEERRVMAQVFLSRLERGITLDADPTVQYAVADDPDSVERFGYWKAGLTLDDLEIDSPYNTYRERGVPPGPICSPRLDSLLAVLAPSDTRYIYFVAKPDGSHAFAETLAEHLENVDRYQR